MVVFETSTDSSIFNLLFKSDTEWLTPSIVSLRTLP